MCAMQRVLEPELMDDPEQAIAYARADFAAVNQGFVDRFRTTFPACTSGRIVDLGCGPADIPIRLARALPAIHVTAVDASAAMLVPARHAISAAGMRDRIGLLQARLPDLPLRTGGFNAILSNSLLHHLPDPSVFWRELRRLGHNDTVILVMDLFRPDTVAQAQAIVDNAAATEPAVLRGDFLNSLLAAFRPAEVAAQLHAAGLGHLAPQIVSERHWLVAGRVAP